MTNDRSHLPGELNENKKGVPPEIAQDILNLDILIGKTFSSVAGREVLKFLRDKYIDGAVEGYVVDRNGSINAEATTFQMYQREGQRILIKNLEMRMKRANSGTVKPSKPKSVT